MRQTRFLVATILVSLVFVTSSMAQDWANFAKFAKDNDSLQTNVKDRIVFMGNSITIGWIHSSPEFFKNKPYVNRGISGQTTPQMLVRFRPDVVNLKPKAVIILAGINDIAGNTGPTTLYEIMDNIKSMCEIAKANKIKVVLSSVLPAFDFPWKPGLNPAYNVIALNKMIKDYADQKGFYYLDYFSSMVDDRNGLIDEYTYDGVHPNKKGYEVMEGLVKKAISKL